MIDRDYTQESKLVKQLVQDVQHLSHTIGQRNLARPKGLADAADWIEARFRENGLDVERQTYEVRGVPCHNLIAEIRGITSPEQILIIGAHYDSAPGTPAANDNGTGVAAMLALAEALKEHQPHRTLRWVAFVNEEPPYFQTEDQMGSWVYARACRRRGDEIVGVISLETMGYYSDEPKSQQYPPPLDAIYPDTGNFIAFVGNQASRELVEHVYQTFRAHSDFPAEMGCFDERLPGVGWSDHWSFWQEGYLGLMVTDTAPFRYPHYHLASDTSDKIDFVRLGRVVEGLVPVVKALCE
ncbi:MAG TPA: M28 family peptidase [Pirellulaceae bacterium]|nr:M28 family peptidase [Pirellulaceae bacterium]